MLTRRLRAGGGYLSRFRRGAGIAASYCDLCRQKCTVPKKTRHSKTGATGQQNWSDRATNRETIGEPTGRQLALVSQCPSPRRENKYVATAVPELFSYLYGASKGVFEQMPGNMSKRERANATLALRLTARMGSAGGDPQSNGGNVPRDIANYIHAQKLASAQNEKNETEAQRCR